MRSPPGLGFHSWIGSSPVREPPVRGGEAFEAALLLSDDAIALDSSYADAFAARARAMSGRAWKSGEPAWRDSAVAAARRAIALDPDFAAGFAELGEALRMQGEREAALEAFRLTVNLDQSLANGLANLNDYDHGRLDEAASWWTRILESDPANPMSLMEAGRTYLHLGMPTRARALFDRARNVEPGVSGVAANLTAMAFLAERRPHEARAEVRRILAATGDAPVSLLFAGRIMTALEDLPEARRYFERGLLTARDAVFVEDSEISLAWILQQSGDAERAQRHLEDASRRLESRTRGLTWRPEDHAQLARIRAVAGDREGAIDAMREEVRRGWRHHAGGLLLILGAPAYPVLGSLRGDPRYDRLIAEVEADVTRMRERVEREGW